MNPNVSSEYSSGYDSPPTKNKIRPIFHVFQLNGRSSIMDHNIKLGIKLMDYYANQGFSPKSALKKCHIYFKNDTEFLETPNEIK